MRGVAPPSLVVSLVGLGVDEVGLDARRPTWTRDVQQAIAERHTRMRTVVEDLDSGEDPGHLVDDYRADFGPVKTLRYAPTPRSRGSRS